MSWREAHPRANVPPEVAERADLHDVSWHNDACPSFVRADASDPSTAPRLWVDYEDPSERECGGSRYFVLADGAEKPVYDGDDVHAALAALFGKVQL